MQRQLTGCHITGRHLNVNIIMQPLLRVKNTKTGSKTANINTKTVYPQCLRRRIKNSKNRKMVILQITLTFKRCDGG